MNVTMTMAGKTRYMPYPSIGQNDIGQSKLFWTGTNFLVESNLFWLGPNNFGQVQIRYFMDYFFKIWMCPKQFGPD